MASTSSLALLIGALIALTNAHSYVTSPNPRNGQQGGCRIGGPPEYPQNCPGPCEQNNYSPNQPRHNVARGDSIRVEWPRNNHPGGFIRLAFLEASKTSEPNAHKLFDGNVVQYSCHEVGCHADSGPGGEGGDSNGQNGDVNPCFTDVTIPPHLSNGVWTMQWSWYGGGHGYLGDYYSCVNFEVNGGPSGPKPEPVFKGGDVSSNDECKYWTTDRLHYCVEEPCSNFCDPDDSPTGTCGQRRFGDPFIDPPISPSEPTSDGNPTTGVPAPVTTGRPAGLPDIEVIITVQLSMSPDVFDPVVFIYDITDLLEIPVGAVRKVEINLDRSTDTTTILTFRMINALDSNGDPIDPVAAAQELKRVVENNDSRLDRYNLDGLTILDESSSASLASACLALIAVVLALLV